MFYNLAGVDFGESLIEIMLQYMVGKVLVM